MRACKMIDNIYTLDKPLDGIPLGDVAADHFEARMRCLMSQQVEVDIDRSNMMPLFELAIHQVASNEAASAGDQNSHV